MPLMKGKSDKAFKHNIRAEMHAGKPQKQSLAIAYAMKRRKKAHGGKIEEEETTEHVPVTGGLTNSFGDSRFTVEHKSGSKKNFYGHEGSMEDTKRQAEEYRKRNLKKMADGGGVKAAPSPSPSISSGIQALANKNGGGQGNSDLSRYAQHAEGGKVSCPHCGNYALGGSVYDVTSPMSLLHEAGEQNEERYELEPTPYDKSRIANHAAMKEDDKDLNQHNVDMQASTSMEEESAVDRIMNKKSKDYSSEARFAKGGEVAGSLGKDSYEDCEQSIVDRIMAKRSNDESKLDRYSEGGKVANQEYGENDNDLAGFSPNEFDDLVLRDDLESTYGDDDNSGDALGNAQEDEDRSDIISRIMKSRAKKDKLPRPA